LFLKALTIRGFKSFARKTVLEFQPGVTIIVGPNGSGKSNIADAVMWVLGEQSPTSLRGNRMEDIIFAGSASIKPVNLAEVALTLDNSSSEFPLEYSEITVSRNVVRGGDSEYRLNNNSCRLLDIQELLSDAGVGRSLNSVISQGQLDDVLSCRPEERRDYIEEAGGLLKYRRRREKAVRRLERLEEELVRTGDVMREVRRQLRPLQQQATRLERYRNLNRELSEAQLRLDVGRLRVLQKEWEGHKSVQDERAQKLDTLDEELAAKTRQALELDRGLSEWSTREAGLRGDLYRLVSVHEQLKAMLAAWRETRKVQRTVAKQALDANSIAVLKAENNQMEIKRQEISADADRLKIEEAELSEKVSRLSSRLHEVTREAAVLEARIEVLRSAGGELGVLVPKLLEDRERELADSLEEKDALAGRLAELDDEAAVRLDGVQLLLSDLEQTRAARLHAEEELLALEREQAGLVATLELLSRLDTRTWSVANVVASLKRDDPAAGGLGGTLVEGLEIKPGNEKAVISFLGPWIFGVIARDTESILAAMKHLKKRDLGQGLFFRYVLESQVRMAGGAAPKGTVAARDVVRAPEWFDGALDSLLAGVFIAGDLEGAFTLAERYPDLVFLSPEGDVVSGGSLFKGGSEAVNPAHLEMTASRRAKIEDELDACRARVEEAQLKIAAIDKEAEELEGEAEKARAGWSESRASIARITGIRDSCIARIAALEEVIRWLTGKGGEDGTAPESVDIDEMNGRLEELKAEESEASARLVEAERARMDAAGSLAKAETWLARLEADIQSGEEKLGKARKALSEAGETSEEALFPADDKTVEAEGRLERVHERLVGLVSGVRERARLELDRGATDSEQAQRTLRTLREEINLLQDKHEELRESMHGEDLSSAELKIRVEQLVERIVDGHQVPLDFAFKQYADEEPSEELEEMVETLASKLEHIGPVNPEAITEREALDERFEFLKDQMEDIEESKVQLRKVVRQIDRQIEDRFKQTLDAVNEHFKEIFSTLFPNGNAELRLTDPDDVLGSGVEIMAQPEGKRLRRISLLSGGETSLTAIAFFFALFKVRPSPFYFLDEVEAALDDVNLHRFLDLVKVYKGESQLILITHQKRSMEIADILYGVTMQDDGVSRVVSQKVAS
jgi:chromosome segregation protein